jgi:hypothetical protein
MLADEHRFRALDWRKATYSTSNGACVEVQSRGGVLAIRDSLDPEGPILLLDHPTWRALLNRALLNDVGARTHAKASMQSFS